MAACTPTVTGQQCGLNQEALEKTIATFDAEFNGTYSGGALVASCIRTYLASLPPVDGSDILEKHGYPRKRDKNEPDVLCGFPPVDVEPVTDEDGGWWEADGKRYVQLAAVEDAKAQLGELLAIIHRDGGHYQETHGTEKAVNDAHQIWADLMSKAEEAEAEVARLKDELAEAHRVIEPFASFFNKVLEGFTPDYLKRRDPESVAFGWNEGHLYLKDFIRARSFRDGQKTGEATAICKSCGQSFPLSAPHDCPGLTAGSQKGASDECT